jgi:hypothetical protein
VFKDHTMKVCVGVDVARWSHSFCTRLRRMSIFRPRLHFPPAANSRYRVHKQLGGLQSPYVLFGKEKLVCPWNITQIYNILKTLFGKWVRINHTTTLECEIRLSRKYFKPLLVCVCARARARVCVCVCYFADKGDIYIYTYTTYIFLNILK